MRRYWRIGAAWLGATALSVAIASAAVAGIRDRVVETPVAVGLPTSTTTSAPAVTEAPPVTTSSTAAPIVTTTSSTIAPPTTTEVTETTAVATTTTAPVTTTTTTTAPPTTTTTTAAPQLEYSTWDLIGGTVVLSFGNGEVRVVSAVPRPGFTYDAEHTGPDEVEVKFVGNDHKSKLEADVEGGELRVDTEEESHDDD